MKLVQCKRLDIDFGIAVRMTCKYKYLFSTLCLTNSVKPLKLHNLKLIIILCCNHMFMYICKELYLQLFSLRK